MASVNIALLAVLFALIASNGFGESIVESNGVKRGGVECEKDADCRVKKNLCELSIICISNVCKCREAIVNAKPKRCRTPADCPFVCPPPCDKQFCNVETGECSCICK